MLRAVMSRPGTRCYMQVMLHSGPDNVTHAGNVLVSRSGNVTSHVMHCVICR